MFFILSSGRSGSATAAETFAQFANCTCAHHPQPELVLEATKCYYGEYSREAIAETLRSTRHPIVRGKVYGEANLQLTLLIPILREVFPDARYLWLTRDGRDVVASMYYRRWYDPTAPHSLWHAARLRGDRTGDFTPSQWDGMNRFDRCCWLWAKYNRIIGQQLQSYGEAYWRPIRLERLRADAHEAAEFLGLQQRKRIRVEQLNTAYQPVIRWERWDERFRGSFEHYCGNTMDSLYPEWRDPQGQWRRLECEKPDPSPGLLKLHRKCRNVARYALRRLGLAFAIRLSSGRQHEC